MSNEHRSPVNPPKYAIVTGAASGIGKSITRILLENDFALLGVWVILATVLVQALVASFAKAARPDHIPGKPVKSSHDSFVFRAERTFMNSLENLLVFLGTALVAVLAGASPHWTGKLIWIFAGARLLHMALYYAIATEKNPSPRSWFYLLGRYHGLHLPGQPGAERGLDHSIDGDRVRSSQAKSCWP